MLIPNRILFVVITILLSDSLFALNNVNNTQTRNSLSVNTITNASTLSMAKRWNISELEWAQYIELMDGPSGHYYKMLSPPEVLGINADNDENMKHFAKIAAQLEHDKLDRELKFNAAFHAAASRLYTQEPLVKSFNLAPFTPIPKYLNDPK